MPCTSALTPALRHRQIYDNIAAAPATSSGEGLQETRLKQDVYYGKPQRKTEALIFGSHDSATLEMTQRISTYLDTLGRSGAMVDVLSERSG